jgi:hypothetical protein
MHDSELVWIATSSLHKPFIIHYTLPIFTGAPNHERGRRRLVTVN